MVWIPVFGGMPARVLPLRQMVTVFLEAATGGGGVDVFVLFQLVEFILDAFEVGDQEAFHGGPASQFAQGDGPGVFGLGQALQLIVGVAEVVVDLRVGCDHSGGGLVQVCQGLLEVGSFIV